MTPICHRLLGGAASMFASHPAVVGGAATYTNGRDDALLLACIGSRCAMWLPSGHGPIAGRVIDPTRGNCADNPYASMWPDPAKESR